MCRLSQYILKYCWILILCVIFNISHAQSLEDFNFEKIKDTSQLVKLLNFAKELSETNPDSALYFYKIAETESVKNGDNKSLMICYYNQAYILFRKGENHQALHLFQESLKLAFEFNSDYYIYSSKTYIGTIYLFFANYNLATQYNIEALRYFEKMEDYEVMSGLYLNMTFIKFEQNDVEGMEYYTNLSYKYSILSGSKEYECKSLLNYGELYNKKGEWNKSLLFYKKSLSMAEDINFKNFIPTIYSNMSNVYLILNKIDSAEYFLEKVIQTEFNPVFIARANISFSNINIKKNNINKALMYANNALKVSIDNSIVQEKGRAYDKLSEIYFLDKNYLKAFQYKKLSSEVYDSIFTSDKFRIQNELESVYQNSKKQKEIEELSKEKEINKLKAERFEYILFFLLFIVLIIVLTGSLILRQNKLKAKHESIELEQRLLRLQMNPHFIFNSISSIQDFILNNNPLEASSYLSDFAKLMRATLTNSSDNFIPLSKEIETTEHYLKLQHLRLSDKFEYKILVSDDIDTDEFNVPPMLMQPFIENSIIHGILKKKDGKGLIKLSYSLNNGSLVIEASDNGIGRDLTTQNTPSKHKSKAIDITNQRINLLSKKYKQNIRFEIVDLKNSDNKSTGTLVRFNLPIR